MKNHTEFRPLHHISVKKGSLPDCIAIYRDQIAIYAVRRYERFYEPRKAIDHKQGVRSEIRKPGA
jgi:hypothetical protein